MHHLIPSALRSYPLSFVPPCVSHAPKRGSHAPTHGSHTSINNLQVPPLAASSADVAAFLGFFCYCCFLWVLVPMLQRGFI